MTAALPKDVEAVVEAHAPVCPTGCRPARTQHTFECEQRTDLARAVAAAVMGLARVCAECEGIGTVRFYATPHEDYSEEPCPKCIRGITFGGTT